MDEIKIHDSVAGLMADGPTVKAALETIAAVQKLRGIFTVNGRTFEGAIRFSDEDAIIEIDISTE